MTEAYVEIILQEEKEKHKDMGAERQQEIHAERHRKLEAARTICCSAAK
jgi:hypothetical protein